MEIFAGSTNGGLETSAELRLPTFAGIPVRKVPLIIEAVEVMAADEAAVAYSNAKSPGRPKVAMPDTRTMRARHHALARALAVGMKKKEVCETFDISGQSLDLLERSPTFQALLLHYMSAADEAAVTLRTQLEAAAAFAVDEVTARLSDPGQASNIATSELTKLTTDLLDRIGHGPVHKTAQVSVALTADDIRAMKAAKGKSSIDYGDYQAGVGADPEGQASAPRIELRAESVPSSDEAVGA